MKKTEYQKFIEFKRRHDLDNKKIQSIMEEYANSGPDFARSYFLKKYEITEYVFYRIRDFAVIFMLVDSKTTNRIFDKASFNSKEHNSSRSSFKSAYHSSVLRQKRLEFFNSFSKSEIEDICNRYAEGSSLEQIATLHDTGITAIKFLLKKGLLLGYVSQYVYQAIELRVKLSGKSLDVIFKK